MCSLMIMIYVSFFESEFQVISENCTMDPFVIWSIIAIGALFAILAVMKIVKNALKIGELHRRAVFITGCDTGT